MKGTSGVSVQLFSWTALPRETAYCVWQRSRNPNFRLTPEEVHLLCEREEAEEPPEARVRTSEVNEIFEKLIETHLPLAEMIWFTFWIDDCPIALREQLVRHRIGTKVNGVPQVDVVPDLPDSTWWAQGMRVLDMANFATEGAYYLPESVRESQPCLDCGVVNTETPSHISDCRTCGGLSPAHVYKRAMEIAETNYKMLVQMGIPREDARGVIPVHANHGLSWSLNLQSLKHIIGKRSCWILQVGQWQALLQGMVKELTEKVHPSFRKLINPPCMKGDDFHDCVFQLDNERRVTGEDQPPPCPLYLTHHRRQAVHISKKAEEAGSTQMWTYRPRPSSGDGSKPLFHAPDPTRQHMMDRQMKQYGELWMRNPVTGVSTVDGG